MRAQPRPLTSPSAPFTSANATYSAQQQSTQPAAAATQRLQFTPAAASAAPHAPPASGGRLAMSHLTSPPPASAYRAASASPTRVGFGASAAASAAAAATRRSAIATISSPGGEKTYVWSPTKGNSLTVGPKSPLRSTVQSTTTSTTFTTPPPAVEPYRPSPSGVTTTNTTTNTTSTVRSSVQSFVNTAQNRAAAALGSPRRPVTDLPAGATSTNSAPVSSLLDSMSELRALIAKKEMELSTMAHSRVNNQAAALGSPSPFAATNQSSFAATIPAGNSNPFFGSPRASPIQPPVSSGLQASASLLQSQLQSQLHSQQVAQSQHELSMRDQEIHEYSIRILSLEQTLLEREEAFQELKSEANRLKKRDESLAADMEVRAIAHKKQIELLNQNLETLTWNRHDSLEQQRAEFERLRKEMMEELIKKEEIAQLRQANANQNLLNYEEQLRAQNAALEEIRAEANRAAEQARATIQKLEAEVDTLKAAKAGAKDQLNSGIKQQLNMTSQLKSLSRKLEETQRTQEHERSEFLAARQRMETENVRVRAELESKTEELVHHLRAVEASMVEQARAAALELQKAELEKEEQILSAAAEREALLEQAHAEKRDLIDEFATKSNESSSALAAAHQHAQHLERDLSDQRHRLQHEAALSQESWNNLVLEKEREIQTMKMEALTNTQMISTLREANSDLDVALQASKLEASQSAADLKHAREQVDELTLRLAETKAAHKAETEEKSLQWNTRQDELQLRLTKSERESEERERALQLERVKAGELSSQLQLLRTSSQNKVRAIEVQRTLEQQALLSDFASQLSRVRTEIGNMKAAPTPKDRAHSRSRRREAERERQADERERSMERSRERMRSPQPMAVATMLASPSAKKHMRVRSIGGNTLGQGNVSFSPQSPQSPAAQPQQQQQQQQQAGQQLPPQPQHYFQQDSYDGAGYSNNMGSQVFGQN